ncbi:MAG: ATP-binding protein [Intrasporangium sp.]|uniref:ATP-binding protein n=1 Tax=Intrasporangium sp. TaxID=1925024 RepID=UPI003F7D8834
MTESDSPPTLGRGGQQETVWQEAILRYGGELGQKLLEYDWAASPLGPMDEWPESLRTAVSLCLTSRFPLLVLWGPKFALIYNDAYLPILGGTKHPAALGTPMEDVWPELRGELLPLLQEVMAGQGPIAAEDHRLRLDRNGYLEEVFVTFSYSPIVDDEQHGEVGGILCAVTETTRHVVYARRVSVLTQLASQLVDLPNATEVCAVAGDILEANSSDHPLVAVFEVVDGVPVSTRSHVHDPRRELLAEVAQQAVSTGESVRVELVPSPESPADLADGVVTGVAALEGAVEPVSALHAIPVRVPGVEGPTAVLVVGQHLQRSSDDAYEPYLTLAALHVRTALTGIHELDAERQRRKALQELDAEKSLFYTNVSHELRTPLTLIHGPIESLIQDPATPGQARDQLELVERNVNRLARMVDAMLDFSRIEAGGVHTELVPVDVTAVTRSLASAFESAFAQAGIAFTVHCDELPGPAFLDQDMYERIVLNLLSNALKYTPEGSVNVVLRNRDDRFDVAVSDTGVGISPEDQERIFGRFEQLPKHPRARAHEGAGIGLAMVKQLSELLGGEVWVHSQPDVGSTFTVSLPYEPGVGAPVPEARRRPNVSRRDAPSFLAETTTWRGLQHEETKPAPLLPSGAGSAPRLLVADDNADMRHYLEGVLSDYAVEVVADGQTALDRSRVEVPDLVLADVMMPGLDGFALVKELRADPLTSDVPIILLSARAGEDATAAGLERGADDYVVKPFSVSELRARIASNLERARSRMRDAAWRRAVMGSLQDPLVIADPEGRVIEVNAAFTDLLGWDLSDGPIEPPHPWWPTAETDAQALLRLQEALAQFRPDEPFSAEVELRTRAGRRVWVRAAGRQVEGGPDTEPLVVITLRDVTRLHEARSRREAAARLSAEFGAAEDLEQVLSAAVAGFTELFDGDTTVRATAGRHDALFTATGPVLSADLSASLVEALAGDPTAGPLRGPVPGILIAPKNDSAECRAWVQFPAPRPVGADERIVGDLLAQAFALAVDRVVAAGQFADREANLQLAIESQRHIGQAVGILVERHRITPTEAFMRIKRASQDRNIKLRELASRIIETGAEPSDAE